MLYKEALKFSMNSLAEVDKTLFIGYNTRFGRANGTLVDVPESQLIETPVAENLMMGMAIGLSLRGYNPVVYFERFDFILNAMDSIVNHLDKINELSNGQYHPKVIIRCVIGGKKNPLFTTPTHTQDFTKSISQMVNFPVVKLEDFTDVIHWYHQAKYSKESMMLVEERDLYNVE
jgi:pyruvate dehydrogenase E1 component beta subunit